MAVKDYDKKTSMGLTLAASEALKKAAKELGVDQNAVVCILAEHFIDIDAMKPHLRQFKRNVTQSRNVKTIATRANKLSPEEKAELLKMLQGETE